MIPSRIFNSGKPVVQIINDTDIGINLQSNHVIGNAIEVNTILSDNELTIASANQEKCSIMPEMNLVDQKCPNKLIRINPEYPVICKFY